MSHASLDVLDTPAQSRLRSIVERIERLEEDKAAVGGDLKEVYAEATGDGFDAKILRKVVRLRKQDKAKRQEEETLLDLYMSAIEGAPVSVQSTVRVAVSVGGARTDMAPDELYPQALEIVLRDRKASASYIQRRLQLGYSRAAALVERMEREGVLAPANHAGKREILLAATQ